MVDTDKMIRWVDRSARAVAEAIDQIGICLTLLRSGGRSAEDL